MPQPDKETEQPAVCRTVRVANQRGLHVRASAKFAKLAGQFESTVEVECRNEAVRGDSILELLSLAAGSGAELSIRAQGPDAAQAVAALADLVAQRKFDEEPSTKLQPMVGAAGFEPTTPTMST